MGRSYLSILILGAVLGLTLARVAPQPRGVPWVGEIRDQGWLDRHESFVQNSITNRDNLTVLFYGDSITDSWDDNGGGLPVFDEFYRPLGTANYGISADRTEHVLWRVDNGEIEGLSNARVCVLKIGTNNIGANSEEDIARGVAAITDSLRSKLPNMKILLLGVLPRNNAETTLRTDNVNRMISILDNGKSVRFLDMKDTFYQGDGVFNTELYTSDLLHLTTAGYAAWAATMNPLFNEMYGQK